jgi:hypothetical protein
VATDINKDLNYEVMIKMTLIAKGIKVEKVCKNEREVYVFERDQPAKNGLLFSGITYTIGKVYLDNI